MDVSIDYATKRQSFGAPISKLQMIQAKIADIGMRIELSRLMMYKAAALYDAGMFFYLFWITHPTKYVLIGCIIQKRMLKMFHLCNEEN